jgi:CheY-like chemotaxis protein/HPt (histidine-containing phosphotransfer) domain-containing protein
MKPAELQKLHEELEAANQGGQHARKCIRLDYVQMSVRVEMHQAGGASISLSYAARNISSEGLGILHNSYVHPSTRCVVFLKHRDGREVPIEASAVRCRHVKGLIHEVGIRFKAPVNVRDFLNVDPMEGSFTLEHVDPSKLRGSLLHVEDSPMDRRLVRHYLAETCLEVVSVETGKAAMERIGQGFDAIIVDNDLSDMTGIELVSTLRAQGVAVPIIMLTADTRPVAKEGARNARVSAIIPKPTNKNQMLQALAEFLIIDSNGASETGGAVVTTLPPQDPTFKFVPEFIEELKQFAEKINKAVATEDAASARRICYQLKGAASALGFAAIGEAANAAMISIDAAGGQSISESGKQLRQLVSLCTRAKIRDEKELRKAG